MYISGPKFEEPCSNIFLGIFKLNQCFTILVNYPWHHHFPNLPNTKASLSLQWKNIFQKKNALVKNLSKMQQLFFISWALCTNSALKKVIVKQHVLLMLLVRKKYLSFGVGVFLEEVTDNFIKKIDGQRYVNCRSACVVHVSLR